MLEVNINRMRALMRDFHTLTGMRMVLFDDGMRELMAYPELPCEFCREMRRDAKFLKKCVACDRAAFAASRDSDGPIIYACHAGLTEAVMRIREGGAYIMFGQVIPKESGESTRARLADACREGGRAGLSDGIRAMPEKSIHEIQAAATILDALSVYMGHVRLVASGGDFVSMLDAYIDAHLSGKIRAEDICRYFGIGRTSLFRAARDKLGMGIADYVCGRRIAKAMDLLTTTDMPVSEIAVAVGFCEYNYFSRVFRDRAGMSPREYRQRAFQTVDGARTHW